MLTKTRIDRRREKTRTFRLGLPLFMQVPKPLAGIGLAGSAYIAVLASHSAPSVAFGPFFILICAFGAWFVGNLFALVLGLFVVSVQILTEHAIALHSGPLVMALQLFSALAVVLMLGVARAALETEWRFARVDPLTGALNRKAFFEAIEKEKGLPGPAALVFADVDGLKRLNDLAGHEAGDEALRDFSARVRRAVRKDDIFARIGGDEFVVFLKVCDLRAADIVAPRQRFPVRDRRGGSGRTVALILSDHAKATIAEGADASDGRDIGKCQAREIDMTGFDSRPRDASKGCRPTL